MKNLQLQTLVRNLKRQAIEQEVKIWKRVASDLEKPTRHRRVVNLYKIDQFAREGEIIVILGKVLAVGELSKKIVVAAFQFSEKAEELINKSGTAISIAKLMKDNPKGAKVRIIG